MTRGLVALGLSAALLAGPAPPADAQTPPRANPCLGLSGLERDICEGKFPVVTGNPIVDSARLFELVGGRIVKTFAGDRVRDWFRGLQEEVAEWVVWQVGKLYGKIDRSTTPDLTQPWFVTHYGAMMAIGLALLVPVFLLGLATAVVRRDGGLALMALGGGVAGIFGMFAAPEVVRVLVEIVRWMSGVVAGSTGANAKEFLARFGQEAAAVPGGTGSPLLADLFALLFALLAAFIGWITMVAREYVIYFAAGFAAVVGAGAPMFWGQRWIRRLASFLGVLIFAEFPVVVGMALGLGILAAGPSETGIDGVMGGATILAASSLVPWALLKAVPFAAASAQTLSTPGRRTIAYGGSGIVRLRQHVRTFAATPARAAVPAAAAGRSVTRAVSAPVRATRPRPRAKANGPSRPHPATPVRPAGHAGRLWVPMQVQKPAADRPPATRTPDGRTVRVVEKRLWVPQDRKDTGGVSGRHLPGR